MVASAPSSTAPGALPRKTIGAESVPEVETLTCSRYTPGAIETRSPARDMSAARWIVCNGCEGSVPALPSDPFGATYNVRVGVNVGFSARVVRLCIAVGAPVTPSDVAQRDAHGIRFARLQPEQTADEMRGIDSDERMRGAKIGLARTLPFERRLRVVVRIAADFRDDAAALERAVGVHGRQRHCVLRMQRARGKSRQQKGGQDTCARDSPWE